MVSLHAICLELLRLVLAEGGGGGGSSRGGGGGEWLLDCGEEPRWSQSAVHPEALGLRSTLGSLPFLRKQVLLRVLSDQSLGFCVHARRSSDSLSKLHPSDIVDCSSPLPHPHLLAWCHPVRKLSYRGALISTGISGGLCTAGVWAGTGTPVRQVSLGRLLDRRFSSCS
ncbi:hypothetical protein EYF80_011359 [Liparis tanakae]|uniref:Secreted protein n=1 Tax=Liparis tanakae TaxID=230148 RepID=A0A4Z2IKN6_9TELE|nr:hypothetical protein EYF80_011359 [Liparis tanakae]